MYHGFLRKKITKTSIFTSRITRIAPFTIRIIVLSDSNNDRTVSSRRYTRRKRFLRTDEQGQASRKKKKKDQGRVRSRTSIWAFNLTSIESSLIGGSAKASDITREPSRCELEHGLFACWKTKWGEQSVKIGIEFRETGVVAKDPRAAMPRKNYFGMNRASRYSGWGVA